MNADFVYFADIKLQKFVDWRVLITKHLLPNKKEFRNFRVLH